MPLRRLLYEWRFSERHVHIPSALTHYGVAYATEMSASPTMFLRKMDAYTISIDTL